MAACLTASGPSVSGKPWPRLTEPVAIANADISAKIVVPSPCRREFKNRWRMTWFYTGLTPLTQGRTVET